MLQPTKELTHSKEALLFKTPRPTALKNVWFEFMLCLQVSQLTKLQLWGKGYSQKCQADSQHYSGKKIRVCVNSRVRKRVWCKCLHTSEAGWESSFLSLLSTVTIFTLSSLWKKNGLLLSLCSAGHSTVQDFLQCSQHKLSLQHVRLYLHNGMCIWWLLPIVCVWSC